MIAELNSVPNQIDQRINMSVPLSKAGTKTSQAIKSPDFLVIGSKSEMLSCMAVWQRAAVLNVP